MRSSCVSVFALTFVALGVGSVAHAQETEKKPRYAVSFRTSELTGATGRRLFGRSASGIQIQLPAKGVVPQLSPDNGWTSYDLDYTSVSKVSGKTSAFAVLLAERLPMARNANGNPGSTPWFGMGLGLSQLNVRVMNPVTPSQIGFSDDKLTMGYKFLLGAPVGSRAFVEFSYRGYGSIFGTGPSQYSLDAGIRF